KIKILKTTWNNMSAFTVLFLAEGIVSFTELDWEYTSVSIIHCSRVTAVLTGFQNTFRAKDTICKLIELQVISMDAAPEVIDFFGPRVIIVSSANGTPIRIES